MNRNALICTLLIAVSSCTFAPKRDLTQLYQGNSREQIRGVLGKPAASYRYAEQDVDIYAFFQGYSQTQQVMMSTGKVMVIVGGTVLIMVVDGIIDEAVYGFHEDPPKDPSQMAAYECRKREHEAEDRKRRAELREQRVAEAQQWREQKRLEDLMNAEDKVGPGDLDPKYHTEVRGQTLHFDNHVYAEGSRHLVFAVNYDADHKLRSVAFLTGMTKASGDAFGRGPETWFKKRGKFPLQDVRESIFFAPPEQIELLEEVTPLPPLQ